MTIEDEVRSMLRDRAGDVSPSPEAWDEIQSRLGAQPRRRWPVVAAAAAVVALVAGGLVVAGDGDDGGESVVAEAPETTTTTSPADEVDPRLPHLWAGEPGAEAPEVAVDYVENRTGRRDVELRFELIEPNVAIARALEGPVVTELLLTHKDDDRWIVNSAASDLVPIHEPAHDDDLFTAEVVAEAAGTIEIVARTRPGGVEHFEGVHSGPVEFREQVSVRHPAAELDWVGLIVMLTTNDGTIALSETWAGDHPDPADVQGELVSLWPMVDADGLAALQADADAGRRPDLLDPEQVAAGFLAERLDETDVTTEPFRQGDNTSGEVEFVLPGEHKGRVLVRRSGGEGSIWYVTNVQSDVVSVSNIEEGDDVLHLTVAVPMGLGDRVTAHVIADEGGRGTELELREHETEVTISIGGGSIFPDRWVFVSLRDGPDVLGITSALLT